MRGMAEASVRELRVRTGKQTKEGRERSHLNGELQPRTLQSDTTDRSQLRVIKRIGEKLVYVHGKLRCVSSVCFARCRGRTGFWVCPSSWMPSSPRERAPRQP
jgi:hypothetical protein